MAEGTGLENQQRRKSFVSSNLTLSLNLARRRNKVEWYERLRGVFIHHYRWRPGSQTGRHHIARVAKWLNAADCKSALNEFDSSNLSPCIYCPVAQLVEHRTVNPVVTGSRPVGAVPNHTLAVWLFLFTDLFCEFANTPYV